MADDDKSRAKAQRLLTYHQGNRGIFSKIRITKVEQVANWKSAVIPAMFSVENLRPASGKALAKVWKMEMQYYGKTTCNFM
jgi:hypothetical protein